MLHYSLLSAALKRSFDGIAQGHQNNVELRLSHEWVREDQSYVLA